MGLEGGAPGTARQTGDLPGLAVEYLLAAHPRFVCRGRRPGIGPVLLQFPGFHIVGKINLQRIDQDLHSRRIFDGDEQLDTTVQIAGHPIGAADEDLLFSALVKIEDTAMLQKAVDDTDDVDVFAHSRNTRLQAA